MTSQIWPLRKSKVCLLSQTEALMSASVQGHTKKLNCASPPQFIKGGGWITLQEQTKGRREGTEFSDTTSTQSAQQHAARQRCAELSVSQPCLWQSHDLCERGTLKSLLLEEFSVVTLPRAPNFITFEIYLFPVLNLFKANGLQLPCQLSSCKVHKWNESNLWWDQRLQRLMNFSNFFILKNKHALTDFWEANNIFTKILRKTTKLIFKLHTFICCFKVPRKASNLKRSIYKLN